MLFDAQRNVQLPTAPASPCPEVNDMDVDVSVDAPATMSFPQNQQQDQRQMTLHSFWKISSSGAPQTVVKPVAEDHVMDDARADTPRDGWFTDVGEPHSRKQQNAIALGRWFSPTPAF
jgi:hypothetical protein